MHMYFYTDKKHRIRIERKTGQKNGTTSHAAEAVTAAAGAAVGSSINIQPRTLDAGMTGSWMVNAPVVGSTETGSSRE